VCQLDSRQEVSHRSHRFRDILSVFLEEGVEFLVVEGYAVAAHGLPMATKGIDLDCGLKEMIESFA